MRLNRVGYASYLYLPLIHLYEMQEPVLILVFAEPLQPSSKRSPPQVAVQLVGD